MKVVFKKKCYLGGKLYEGNRPYEVSDDVAAKYADALTVLEKPEVKAEPKAEPKVEKPADKPAEKPVKKATKKKGTKK